MTPPGFAAAIVRNQSRAGAEWVVGGTAPLYFTLRTPIITFILFDRPRRLKNCSPENSDPPSFF